MNEFLIPNANLYALRCQIEIREKLGSGKDGIVVIGERKTRPASVAIKVLRWAAAYEREKQVYLRLRQAGTGQVLGFNVPQLIGLDDDLKVLEMTIVERPFVLDFAGAHLDARPYFAAEIWADWEADKREQFEDRWPMDVAKAAGLHHSGSGQKPMRRFGGWGGGNSNGRSWS